MPGGAREFRVLERPMTRIGWLMVVTSVCAAVSTLAGNQNQLPDGEGKAQVEASCTARCHTAGTVVRTRRTPAGWETVINLMIERGAEVTDEQYGVILDYLSRHFLATVNVNAEPAARIAEVLEISEKEALAIVECRTTQGPFKTWEDVARVPGVDAKIIEERKARIAFQ
jgi:competence protein ComEA